MGAMVTRKRLASDTNLLFDLADKKEFALDFLDAFRRLGYSFLVPPTVVQEVAHQAFVRPIRPGNAQDVAERQRANIVLESMLSWGFRPYDLIPTGHGVTEQFYRYLVSERLLPEAECNDGFILAECALGGLPMLVTSDNHLLSIDEARLRYCFESRDLIPVAVASPRGLLRAVGR